MLRSRLRFDFNSIRLGAIVYLFFLLRSLLFFVFGLRLIRCRCCVGSHLISLARLLPLNCFPTLLFFSFSFGVRLCVMYSSHSREWLLPLLLLKIRARTSSPFHALVVNTDDWALKEWPYNVCQLVFFFWIVGSYFVFNPLKKNIYQWFSFSQSIEKERLGTWVLSVPERTRSARVLCIQSGVPLREVGKRGRLSRLQIASQRQHARWKDLQDESDRRDIEYGTIDWERE